MDAKVWSEPGVAPSDARSVNVALSSPNSGNVTIEHNDNDALVECDVRQVNEREKYVDVCSAARLSIERALKHRLSGGALKLLLAIHHFLTAWSRTWDYISYSQLADMAKMHRRSAIRLLPELVAIEAIRHEPGGPKGLSKIMLPVVTKPQHHSGKETEEQKTRLLDGIEHIFLNGQWVESQVVTDSQHQVVTETAAGGDKDAN